MDIVHVRMPFHAMPHLRNLLFSPRVNSTNESLSVELERELEDWRKCSLNLLMAFLSIPTVSASNALGAVTLALLVYTLNLHVAANTSFLQSNPTLSRSLHAVPLFGIFCMAVFELVDIVKSPAIVSAVLVACSLPPLITTVHLARRYASMVSMPFPVQIQETKSTRLGVADAMTVSS